MFEDEPLRSRLLFYGILLVFAILIPVLAFAFGVDYQKEHGAPGSECKAGTYRQVGDHERAAKCVNGFWFELLPPHFPPEPKKR